MPLSASQETLYAENQAGQLYYHPGGWVRLAWKPGRLPVEVIQEFYEQALKLLRQTGARAILSEHGQRAPLPPAAQSWLTTDWIPRAISQAHAHHCAIVEGADPVHRLSTQSVVSASPTGLHFERFHDRPAAEAWLRALPR